MELTQKIVYDQVEKDGIKVFIMDLDTWYQVAQDSRTNEFFVIEICALPEKEDLTMYFEDLDDAVLEARRKNVEIDRTRGVKFISPSD